MGTDVLVIGGGNAALCAALMAREAGASVTLLEAAAMGRPLVATDVPGCREVVQDGVNGYLCQVKDASALAGAMEKIITLSPSQRRALGDAGRHRVEERFAEGYVIDCYLRAISDMVR